MTCDQARRLLSARLDHPLAPASATALRAHLAECPACARFDARLRAHLADLARLPEAPSPARARRAAAPPFRRRPPVGMWAGRVALVAVFTLFLLAAAGLAAPLSRAPVAATASPPLVGGVPVAERPASSSAALAFAFGGTPAAATPPRDLAIGAGATPQALAPAAVRPYSREEEERVWAEVAGASGASIGAIVRPTYLPGHVASIYRVASAAGTINVGYNGEAGTTLNIVAGMAVDEASLGAVPTIRRAAVTVRGQNAVLLDTSADPAGGALAAFWEEPGRWDVGTPFVRDRIRYAVLGRGLPRAEFDRVVASLAVQTTAPVAEGVVQRFYAAINARDFPLAYALFSPDWQAQQPYEDFAGGFADTEHDDLEILGVRPADAPGHYEVQIRLAALQRDGRRDWFVGSYEIAGPPGEARIVAARVSGLPEVDARGLQGAPAPPTCGAQQVALALPAAPPAANALPAAGTPTQLQVELANRGALCRLMLPFDLTILDTRGSALAIEGNGVVWTPNGNLQPGRTVLTLSWSNWCGAGGPYTIRATLGGQSIAVARPEAPPCTAAQARSVLTGP